MTGCGICGDGTESELGGKRMEGRLEGWSVFGERRRDRGRLRESNRTDMVGVVKGERVDEAKLLVKRKLGRSMVGGLGKPLFDGR